MPFYWIFARLRSAFVSEANLNNPKAILNVFAPEKCS
jgi:hypothetical protein